MEVQRVNRQSHGSVARLARWWRQTSEAQRFEALKASIRGDAQAPELATLHLAVLFAEIEAAAERVASREAPHGAAAADA